MGKNLENIVLRGKARYKSYKGHDFTYERTGKYMGTDAGLAGAESRGYHEHDSFI